MKNNLKPFDLEAAKRGDPVVTREGNPVRIICFDRIALTQPIVGLMKSKDDEPSELISPMEKIVSFSSEGRYLEKGFSDDDLFMKPKTKTVFIGIKVSKYPPLPYRTTDVYDSKEEIEEEINTIHGDDYKIYEIEIEV